MNPLRLAQHSSGAHLVPRQRPARDRQFARPRPGGPGVRMASPMRSRVVRSRASARMRFASPSPVSSRSSTTSAPPTRAMTSAFLRWWSSVAVGSGTRIAGRPAAASSDSVVAPARQITRSAAVHLPIHVVHKGLDPRFEPRLPVGLSHQLHIALPGLMRDRQIERRRLPAASLPPPWPR